MIESELMHLLNGELDGELTESEQQRLAEHLVTEPGSQGLQQDLQAIGSLLASVPDVLPPPGLREQIIANIPLSNSARSEKRKFPSVHQLWQLPLKPALAMAAALVVALALVQLAPGNWGPLEIEQVTGTMVKGPADMLFIDRPGLSASVSFVPSVSAGLLVDIKVDSTTLTSTLLEVPNQSYKLEPLGSRGTDSVGMESKDYSLLINSVGLFEIHAALKPGTRLAQPVGDDIIRVQFMQADTLVYEALLRIPEQTPGPKR